MNERRKHKRWLLSSYIGVFEKESDLSIGKLSDISRGGFMMNAKHPVKVNIVMPLRIGLKDENSGKGQMKVVTRTVRCGKDKDENYNIGLKLIDLSSDNLTVINQLIEMYAI